MILCSMYRKTKPCTTDCKKYGNCVDRKDLQYSNKAILTNKKGGRNVVTK